LDDELLARGRVNLPVAVQHDFKAGKKAFRSYDFGRVGVTGQRDHLANSSKRATDCAIFYLDSVTIVACADLCSKSGKELDQFGEVGILKVRVHSHRRRRINLTIDWFVKAEAMFCVVCSVTERPTILISSLFQL
jgi:hypothetical protein